MNEHPNETVRTPLWHHIYAIVSKIPRKDVEYDVADAVSVSTDIEKLFNQHSIDIDNNIIIPPVYDESGKQILPEKRYRIDTVNSRLEWFTYMSIFPNHSGYVVVIDQYEKPQRMIKSEWDKMNITSYDEAKKALVDHLTDMVNFYKNETV